MWSEHADIMVVLDLDRHILEVFKLCSVTSSLYSDADLNKLLSALFVWWFSEFFPSELEVLMPSSVGPTYFASISMNSNFLSGSTARIKAHLSCSQVDPRASA